jgi:diketogulonate reductase-like aldo/keto reductase
MADVAAAGLERDRRRHPVEQIEANVKAIDWTLDANDLAEIDRITAA